MKASTTMRFAASVAARVSLYDRMLATQARFERDALGLILVDPDARVNVVGSVHKRHDVIETLKIRVCDFQIRLHIVGFADHQEGRMRELTQLQNARRLITRLDHVKVPEPFIETTQSTTTVLFPLAVLPPERWVCQKPTFSPLVPRWPADRFVSCRFLWSI